MYRSTVKILLLLLPVLFLNAGCGYREGVTVKEPIAYLWFTGKTEGAFAKIDDMAPFQIQEYAPSQGNERSSGSSLKYFQISPGKHRVIVQKGTAVVVDRILYVGNGNIQEIQVP